MAPTRPREPGRAGSPAALAKADAQEQVGTCPSFLLPSTFSTLRTSAILLLCPPRICHHSPHPAAAPRESEVDACRLAKRELIQERAARLEAERHCTALLASAGQTLPLLSLHLTTATPECVSGDGVFGACKERMGPGGGCDMEGIEGWKHADRVLFEAYRAEHVHAARVA